MGIGVRLRPAARDDVTAAQDWYEAVEPDRFPFLVFYRVKGQLLEIVRVLHERRDIDANLISR